MHIALLKGVNLGNRRLPMAELTAMFVKAGFADARTLLASGNVVFTPKGKKTAAQLEALLEAETEKRFGFRSDYFIRSPEEWAGIVEENPFTKEAASAPGLLHVLAAKTSVTPAAVKALQAAVVGREVVKHGGRHIYAFYPDGAGESKMTTALMEKKLGTRVTARNWNTVLKLKALTS